MTPGSLAALLERATEPSRWGVLLLGALRRLVYFQLWGLHLLAAALATAWLLRRRAGWAVPEGKVALSAAGLVLAGFFAAYLFSPHDVAWHWRTSIDRLILQVWPVALAGIFLALPAPPGPDRGRDLRAGLLER
jgi:hypothetical protein